jgi:hypothetical protein
MLATAAFLIVVGLLLLLRPDLVWQVTEQWKSSDATEPSSLYMISTRFGGIMCLLVGLASLLVALL